MRRVPKSSFDRNGLGVIDRVFIFFLRNRMHNTSAIESLLETLSSFRLFAFSLPSRIIGSAVNSTGNFWRAVRLFRDLETASVPTASWGRLASPQHRRKYFNHFAAPFLNRECFSDRLEAPSVLKIPVRFEPESNRCGV